MATDPICGMFVREDASVLTATREGRAYYFCSHHCLSSFEQPEKDRRWLLGLTIFAWIAGLLVMLVMFLPRLPFEAADTAERMWLRNWVTLALAAPVQFVAGARFYRGLAHAVRARAANMDTLIALGTTVAFAYSVGVTLRPETLGHDTYFDVSVLVIAFILLGRSLELAMKKRATTSLRALLDLQPRTAHVIRNGVEEDAPVESIRVGDRFRVRAGERVPTDGVVLEGQAAVDESMLTGESVPVAKAVGDEVAGGAINTSGVLLLEARRVGADTLLAQIAGLVESAQAGRAPIQRLVDTVSAYFVPLVVGVAVLSFLGWWFLADASLARALLPPVAVLIIACPCALGLATPAALLVTVAKGAEHGLLVKETDQLEALARVDTIVFDKTGTLTQGRHAVTDVAPAAGRTADEVVALAAAAEEGSTHPLARALVTHARTKGVAVGAAQEFAEEAGHGVRATIGGRVILVGTPRWMERNGVDVAPVASDHARLQEMGKTALYVAQDDHVVGLVALADQLKDGATEAVASLQRLGLRVVLVTGDSRRTAEAIAKPLGVKEVDAEVLPADKADLIRKLREGGSRVAMVGDGVNDAPALAAADVGIALGSGTDVAKEAGGLLLLKDDPRDVANAVDLARKGLRKIHQNLFWAFVYNVALVPVAALGLLHPILAGAAMGLSSVTVVGNSLLLRTYRPRHRASGAVGAHAPRPGGAAPGRRLGMAAPQALGREVDPVCGMTVDPARANYKHAWEETTYFFCSPGCLDRFRTDPRACLAATPTSAAMQDRPGSAPGHAHGP